MRGLELEAELTVRVVRPEGDRYDVGERVVDDVAFEIRVAPVAGLERVHATVGATTREAQRRDADVRPDVDTHVVRARHARQELHEAGFVVAALAFERADHAGVVARTGDLPERRAARRHPHLARSVQGRHNTLAW